MIDDGLPALPDEKTPVPLIDRRKGALVRGIIISGWVLTLLTMVAIVGASLFIIMHGGIVPDNLAQWTGVALGFLFGTFTNIVTAYIQEGSG